MERSMKKITQFFQKGRGIFELGLISFYLFCAAHRAQIPAQWNTTTGPQVLAKLTSPTKWVWFPNQADLWEMIHYVISSVSVSTQCFCDRTAGCWNAKRQNPSHQSWKFAACVESQKSMPITAVAVSPAGSSSVNTQEHKHHVRQQLFDLRLNIFIPTTDKALRTGGLSVYCLFHNTLRIVRYK